MLFSAAHHRELYQLEGRIDKSRHSIQGKYLKALQDSDVIRQGIKPAIREHDVQVMRLSKASQAASLFGGLEKAFV